MALLAGLIAALLAYALLRHDDGALWTRVDTRVARLHRRLVGQMADIELSTIARVYWGGVAIAFLFPTFVWPGSVGAGIIIAAAVGWFVPDLLVDAFVRRRRQKIETQMIDGLRLCGNGLGAGLSLPQAFQVLAEQGPRPLADEVGLMMKEYGLGVPLDQAMEHLAARLDNADFTMTVAGLSILRETGGDLTETFERMVTILRDRHRVQQKVRTVSAQGRTEAWLISLSPAVLLGVMYFVNPETVTVLFVTPFGWMVLGLSALLAALGWFTIQRLLDVPV